MIANQPTLAPAHDGQGDGWPKMGLVSGPQDSEPANSAHRRPGAVEQFHEEAKGKLGWDHYQGRLWPGFHRHAVTVMLAYSVLVWLELRARHRQGRRGRPRDPFSPSPRSASEDTTGCAS